MIVHLAAVLLALIGTTLANRAFPLDSENFAIEQFQLINPNIQYDESNFLVDLSGRYVVCSRVGQRGAMTVTETLEDGTPLSGLIDHGYGSATHVNAVKQYIEETLEAWTYDPEFSGTIMSSTSFGCSVRPGCNDNYVVGCVFNGPSNYRATTPGQGQEGGQNAQAFTEDQYFVAELLTGVRWGRDHYLENLSGFQTECGMVGRTTWDFTFAREHAEDDKGWIVDGLVGSALNRGETQPAMEEVLLSFDSTVNKVQPKLFGCSVIPDCIFNNQMFVVISCVYRE